MRSDVTSRSNWANESRTFNVSRHGRRGVELLSDRDERDIVLVEELDQLGEVRQRARQAVDLVDHDDIELAGPHVIEQALQGRAINVAARKATVVVFGSQKRPARMSLAADISLRGVVLGIERVEVLLELLVSRDPGIDRAANRL